MTWRIKKLKHRPLKMSELPSKSDYRLWKDDLTSKLFFSVLVKKRYELVQDLIESTTEEISTIARIQGKITIIDDLLELQYNDLVEITKED